MIKEIIENEVQKYRKFFYIELLYIIFDVLTIVVVNSVIGGVLPEESNFRNLLFFLMVLLLNIFLYLMAQKISIRMIQSIVVKIRWTILEKIQNTDLQTFEKLGKSQIYNAITLDTQTISDIAYMVRWLSDIMLICVGLLTYQFLVCKIAFFYTSGIFMIGILTCAYNIVKVKRSLNNSREKEKELFDGISDMIYGFKELKINDKKNDDFFYHYIKAKSSDNKRYRIEAGNIFVTNDIFFTIIEILAFIPIIFILPFSGHFSIHDLAVSLTCLLFIPFDSIKDSMLDIIRGFISVERINFLMEKIDKIKKEDIDKTDDKKIYKFQEIQYDDISFTYTDNDDNPLFSIDNIEFLVHPGEIIFITGGNGSGKSTLLKVITGLYTHSSGNIKIDNLEVNMADNRHLFSIIFTDFHLFDTLYGLKQIDEKKVQELINLMQLEDKITFKDNRFSSLDLSTGQRKRLALIMAILEDKPIYIFDEWASDQAPNFRDYFYRNLLPSFKNKGKTVIAVTHDDRFFDVADRILKLEYGQCISLT